MKTGKSNKIKWAQAVKPMRAVGTETVAKGTFASEATLHTRQQSSAAGASSCGVDTQDAASNMSRAAYNVYPPAGSSAYIRIRRHPTVWPGREHHGSARMPRPAPREKQRTERGRRPCGTGYHAACMVYHADSDAAEHTSRQCTDRVLDMFTTPHPRRSLQGVQSLACQAHPPRRHSAAPKLTHALRSVCGTLA
jgi:hypothetical protein